MNGAALLNSSQLITELVKNLFYIGPALLFGDPFKQTVN